jgi:hypothetical protein
VGDLGAILTDPRMAFTFPESRRFVDVVVRGDRACALDDAGRPSCCGPRLAQDPPAGPFAQLALGDDLDCGVTVEGALRCWGRDPPAGGAPVAGPFRQVSIGDGVCVVRRDTGALQCWRPAEKRWIAQVGEGIRAVAAFKGGVCALDQHGEIDCRASSQDKARPPSHLHGPFRALATSPRGDVCALTEPGGRGFRCWFNDGWYWQRSSEEVELFPQGAVQREGVALALGHGWCALARTGEIACGSKEHSGFPGRYRALAGGVHGLCAVTRDGRVECDTLGPCARGNCSIVDPF